MKRKLGAARIARLVGAVALMTLVSSGGLVSVPAIAQTPSDSIRPHSHDHGSRDSVRTVKMDADDVTIEATLLGGYAPASVEIKTGTTVTWHNGEQLDYPVVSGYHQVVEDDGAFESERIAPNARWSYSFMKPGTYTYHCGVHATMTGEIIVKGAPVKEDPKEAKVQIVEDDPNDQNSWGFDPDELNVEVGTTVTWTNNGSQDHTVEDDDDAFNSGTLSPGDKFTFEFDKAGVYNYFCKPHPWMKASVTVSEPGKAPPKEEPEDESDDGAGSYPPPSSSSSGGGGSGPSSYGVNIVEGSSTDSWGYDPSSLQVQVGDTVTWTNVGTMDHTVTEDSGAFDSGSVGPGGTFEYTFDEVGTFAYHCDPHPFMVATVTVTKAPPPEGANEQSGAATDDGTTTEDEAAATDDAAEDGSDAVEALELTAEVESRAIALLSVVALIAACGSFLVGRWWGQAIGIRPNRGT